MNQMRCQMLSVCCSQAQRRAATRTTFRQQFRCLQSSSTHAANPIPHPTAPGPPPKPPQPSATFEGDRVARKRKQADLLKLGEQLKANPAKPGNALQKRFWKIVSIRETENGDFQIMLDSRPVRRPSKQELTIPKEKPQLATAIAIEWDSLITAHQALKQHYIPITSLTSRALDILEADHRGDESLRGSLVKMLMNYLKTDTLLCWVPEKSNADAQASSVDNTDVATKLEDQAPGAAMAAQDSLRKRQEQVAAPIISHLSNTVWPGVEITPVLDEGSIVAKPQPEMTTHVIHGWLSGLPAFELAGLERAVLATKSLCVGSRLLVQWSSEFEGGRGLPEAEGDAARFGIEDAAHACSQEVLWQTQMWGEVEDTHDVDKEDVRRQLGSVVLLVSGHA